MTSETPRQVMPLKQAVDTQRGVRASMNCTNYTRMSVKSRRFAWIQREASWSILLLICAMGSFAALVRYVDREIGTRCLNPVWTRRRARPTMEGCKVHSQSCGLNAFQTGCGAACRSVHSARISRLPITRLRCGPPGFGVSASRRPHPHLRSFG
jgi:hypothetical protein